MERKMINNEQLLNEEEKFLDVNYKPKKLEEYKTENNDDIISKLKSRNSSLAETLNQVNLEMQQKEKEFFNKIEALKQEKSLVLNENDSLKQRIKELIQKKEDDSAKNYIEMQESLNSLKMSESFWREITTTYQEENYNLKKTIDIINTFTGLNNANQKVYEFSIERNDIEVAIRETYLADKENCLSEREKCLEENYKQKLEILKLQNKLEKYKDDLRSIEIGIRETVLEEKETFFRDYHAQEKKYILKINALNETINDLTAQLIQYKSMYESNRSVSKTVMAQVIKKFNETWLPEMQKQWQNYANKAIEDYKNSLSKQQ